jgi:lambda family phage portal protein
MTSWLDRSISWLAPQWALKRTRARAVTDFVVRHYEAAATGRRTQGWRRPGGDANAVIGPASSRVRAIARDLARNNPHAKSGINTISDHIVGWGITPKPKRPSPGAADAWNEWAESTACDADGRNNLYGLQKLVARTVVESGEVLVRRRWRRPEDELPLPLQIQVIEPDYIDTARTGEARDLQGRATGRIVNGIEFDLVGRRVAYWLFREHPGSSSFAGGYASRRVPADGVLHVYYQERPGQVRGMSWLAPIALAMKDFDEYVDAQLLKQKIAAYLAVIMTDPTGESPRVGISDDQDAEQPYVDRLRPGALIQAPPGQTVEVVQPPRVSEFKDYSEVTLRAIATGMGVSYEDLTGDYTNLPFSAARMSRIRHWARVDDWRWQMIIPQFCDPVWRWAMEAAVIMGRVREDPRALWTAPPMPMIEPDKEGLAYQRNIRSGLQSLSEALRERGYGPGEVLDEMAKDNEQLDKLGLVLDSDPRRTTQAGNPVSAAGGAPAPPSAAVDG